MKMNPEEDGNGPDEKSIVYTAINTINEIYVHNSSYTVPTTKLYDGYLLQIMDNYKELHKWKRIDYKKCAKDIKFYLSGYMKNRSYIQIQKNIEFPDAYSEFHRPLSARQITCVEQFILSMAKGKKEDAFFELYECVSDYGRANMQKLVSANEYAIYMLMVNMLIS